LNVYEAPFVRPATVHDVADVEHEYPVSTVNVFMFRSPDEPEEESNQTFKVCAPALRAGEMVRVE